LLDGPRTFEQIHEYYRKMVMPLNVLMNSLLVIWEFPQTLTGSILFLIKKRRGRVYGVSWERARLFVRSDIGVSLGLFVFWVRRRDERNHASVFVNKEHEYGHAIQSRLFGPFYLPLIGVPSISRVFYSRYYRRRYDVQWRGYYSGYPENWADRLGRVDSVAGRYLG
jgi:hypothetical protein